MAKNLQVGEAGVLRVIAELLAHDFVPYRPVVDDHGIDILLLDGTRIQVKTSTLRPELKKYENAGVRTGGGRLVYKFSFGWRAAGEGKKHVHRAKNYSSETDYFVLVGLDENRFWIVPSFLFDNRRLLVLGPKRLPTHSEVMALAKEGKGLQEIAREFGCGITTVWKRKHEDTRRGGWAQFVRTCESRWDLLKFPAASWMEAVTEIRDEAVSVMGEVQQLEKLVQL